MGAEDSDSFISSDHINRFDCSLINDRLFSLCKDLYHGCTQERRCQK